ncbi:MAG: extracellular solute-binding protein [Chloroflexi bacterium]|nr:extracellular solute-binding protein [Chloroflexota bacterium]
MNKLIRIIICIGLFTLAGCQLTSHLQVTPVIPTKVKTPTMGSFLKPTPTSSTTTLRIWLPPQFAPNSNTSSGLILQKRLEEFTTRRPGVEIEIRQKSEEGAASLINSLVATSAAAQEALPDLIALPQTQLQVAVLKGVLHPYDGLTDVIDDDDWFEYARQLGRLQNSTFGLPFAGDGLILVYRSDIETPPISYTDFFSGTNSLIFPAGDPKGLYPFALYLASGGSIYDEKGKVTISADPLISTLSFFDQAIDNHLLPSWITQIQNEEQGLKALDENRVKMAVTWISQYNNHHNGNYLVTTIPTQDGKPFTLATGWVWALANPHRGDQALVVELAEYLSDAEFQAKWNLTSGYLPTRRSVLESWQDPQLINITNQITASANIIAGIDDINRLSSIFYKATLNVIQGEKNPATAAEEAIDSLNQP